MTDFEEKSVPQDATQGFRPLSRRTFMVAGTASVVAASVLGAAPQASAAPTTGATPVHPDSPSPSKGTLKVGVGKAAISIPASLLPLDNFTTVHDDLYVKVMLMETKERRVAFVVLDLTSISDEATGLIRTAITNTAGVASSDTIVTVTHAFSAPHVMSASQSAQEATWVANIVAAAQSATNDALASLKIATIGYGRGKADVNVNRNVETADGYWLGTNEQLPSDKHVGVARINDAEGNPIAVLINYNVQSCVMQDSLMASGDLPITSDLAGAACAHVEEQYPGAIAFWIVGACGDQFPAFRSKRYTIDKDKNWTYGIDAHDAGFLLLTVQGERLGTEVVRVAQTIETTKDASLDLVINNVTVDLTNPAHTSGPVKSADFSVVGTATTPVWILRVGNGVIAGAKPELSTNTATYIKENSAFAHTFVASMFDGGAKNMPEKWDYDHVTYEAVDGFFAKGTAAKVANLIVRAIRTVK